jgi:hypothetical protein
MTKQQQAMALIDLWLADTSGYDQRVWPRLARAIERNRLSSRRRFLGGRPSPGILVPGYEGDPPKGDR